MSSQKMRTTYCGLVTEALLGQTITLCGWVNRRRDHGGVIFVDLRDREGYVQVVCDPDREATFATADKPYVCIDNTAKTVPTNPPTRNFLSN